MVMKHSRGAAARGCVRRAARRTLVARAGEAGKGVVGCGQEAELEYAPVVDVVVKLRGRLAGVAGEVAAGIEL